MPDIPSKFQKDPSITFRVILLTHRQTNRQTETGKNITSLAEVKIYRQPHKSLPNIASPRRKVFPADNLLAKIRPARAAAERGGILPANCQPGETFLGAIL